LEGKRGDEKGGKGKGRERREERGREREEGGRCLPNADSCIRPC